MPGKFKTLASFQNVPFRFYFLGMIGQWGAMSMLLITQSLLVFRITGSAAIMGTLALATAIPQVLLFLVGGAMADRFSKRRLLQIGQTSAGLMALIPGIAISIGYMSPEHPNSWWVLVVTSVIQSAFQAVSVPARQAIIPDLVPTDSIMNAIALSTTGTNVFRLIAPAVAGFLIDTAGFAAVYYLMAGLYGMAVLFTAFIPETFKPTARKGNAFSGAGEGLVYIWKNRIIFLILTYAICFILLFMPYQTMLPLFTETILKVGATELGLLQSVLGIGALIMSIILASIPTKRHGAMVMGGGMLCGLGLVLLSFSHLWYLSLAAMFIVGIGNAMHATSLTVAIQISTAPEYLGRVMSILQMNQGLSGLGTFLVGFLTVGIGVQWAIGGTAIGLAVLSASFLAFSSKVRQV